MSVEYIAQRLLNPYRGVMHIIRYASAEAVTLDGTHWDTYVANEALLGRRLPMEAFPPLLLASAGHDGTHSDLIADFHAWQAPWLLSLSRLEPDTRQQALAVEKHYRLYPEIIDQSGIKATLVEAMLCRSQVSVEPAQDATMSTFYIELAPKSGW